MTKGKGIIVTGGVANQADLRAPRDIGNLCVRGLLYRLVIPDQKPFQTDCPWTGSEYRARRFHEDATVADSSSWYAGTIYDSIKCDPDPMPLSQERVGHIERCSQNRPSFYLRQQLYSQRLSPSPQHLCLSQRPHYLRQPVISR